MIHRLIRLAVETNHVKCIFPQKVPSINKTQATTGLYSSLLYFADSPLTLVRAWQVGQRWSAQNVWDCFKLRWWPDPRSVCPLVIHLFAYYSHIKSSTLWVWCEKKIPKMCNKPPLLYLLMISFFLPPLIHILPFGGAKAPPGQGEHSTKFLLL